MHAAPYKRNFYSFIDRRSWTARLGQPVLGFEGRVPATVPDLHVAEHRWHVVCELGKWIGVYLC
ncbi:hypothetical protein IU427_24550 [Nocardia beijingensis]|uniref:hypothetical protein n=1 Tax=Nocardia beijingensis TaxID=95162 RepID=UPI001893904C|nr:hypothetical protein [Nocardia beijingensis]MBF6468316.1 hypothetical protein [Nocardia beijingensis]